jgi:major vault protein
MQTPLSERQERDLILNPKQFAFILDQTKGLVGCYVGPHKVSVSNTDRPVIFDSRNRKFVECNLAEAIQEFPLVDEGSYMELLNPASANKPVHPTAGKINDMSDSMLDEGRKVNIPGPVSFPLWPGQIARVVTGHQLRSNEYLLARVYNAEAAKENWGKAVIQPQTSVSQDGDGEEEPKPQPEVQAEDVFGIKPEELTMGQLLIIKGTDVSFYIPPTGVEVVGDEESERDGYTRRAVTLERLEYCILLDEDGNKRYVRGPDVVFPQPTERFVTRKVEANSEYRGKAKGGKTRRFKAIELNEISGIYVKVIAPYIENEGKENEKSFKVGDELFITGKEQAIYFPRPEHAILRYGDNEIHYAVAIPEGEARYVMNRLTGKIDTLSGPKMFLPDPRTEVIVRRVLADNQVSLWYPGNEEALAYNRQLAAASEGPSGFVTEKEFSSKRSRKRKGGKQEFGAVAAQASSRGLLDYGPGAEFMDPEAQEAYMPDAMDRKTVHTPPRTVTLDTKYDGAVAISVWTGYAVLVVSKTGQRRVIEGPTTVILNYDETLETLELSTGTPKSDDRKAKTVYLRISNNTVSDRINAVTKDLVDVNVKVSYRVNFDEEESEKWFAVENYVKFLTDHLRSLVRGAVKRVGVEEFNDSATDIIRDTILGETSEGDERRSRAFVENGMRVVDVEVLSVTIGDEDIADLLVQTQHSTVQSALQIRAKEQELEVTKRREKIDQEIEATQQETRRKREEQTSLTAKKIKELEAGAVKDSLELALAKVLSNRDQELATLEAEKARDDASRAAAKETRLADIENRKAIEEQEHLASKIAEENSAVITGLRYEREEKSSEHRRVLEKAEAAQRLAITKESDEHANDQNKIAQELSVEFLDRQTAAKVKQIEAVSSDFIAALESHGDKEFAKTIAESLGAHALLQGKSVADVFAQLVNGSPGMGDRFVRLLETNTGEKIADQLAEAAGSNDASK